MKALESLGAAPRAIHLPGGNRFDDVRIDLASSFARQDQWLDDVERTHDAGGRARSLVRLALVAGARQLRVLEPATTSGLRHAWFDEFHRYWLEVIGGRPLTVADFHGLRVLYRARSQHRAQLHWADPTHHIANWQQPEQISSTFQHVWRQAIHPVSNRQLLFLLRPGMRVLEFGCGLGPAYRTSRWYVGHRRTQWVLADLPGFPFHYARHVFAADRGVTFVTITPDSMNEPLRGVDGTFDVIIVQEVFEHLHAPLLIADYLLDRLRVGGLFLFDYVLTEGLGNDTPAGVDERPRVLDLLSRRLEIVAGDFRLADESLGPCVGRRVA